MILTKVIFLAVQVYFAICLFSLYYQLKNKKEQDVELSFVSRNNLI